MTKLPNEVNVLGKRYTIICVDNPVEVDPLKRSCYWGHIDFWTRTIHIYVGERPNGDAWHSILHEVLHAIAKALNMEKLDNDEDTVDLLALALADVLIRNDWLKTGGKEKEG